MTQETTAKKEKNSKICQTCGNDSFNSKGFCRMCGESIKKDPTDIKINKYYVQNGHLQVFK